MNAAEVVARLAPEHRSIITAALGDIPAATDAWRAWRSLVNFDEIDDPSTRLLPLVARRPDVIPADDPVRKRVLGVYRQTWVSNHRLWQAAAPTIETLIRADIPVMVLKGSALLHWYGDDWGVRPMYDIDLAVPVRSLGDALTTMERAGWTPELGQTTDWVRHRMRRSRHSWGFASAHGGRLDLHWRVLPGSMWDRADESFWTGTTDIDIAGLRVARMHPADLLVHVLLHGVYELNRPPLQWMADVVHLTRGIEPAQRSKVIDRFVTHARLHGALRVARAGLGAIHHVIGDTSIEPFLTALEGHDSTIERLRHHRGPGAEQLAQLSRNATGGAGITRGLLGLAARRMELDLAARRPAMTLYVASGRAPAVARILRRRRGPFVRVPAEHPSPLHTANADSFDLTDPHIVDQVGATGWGAVRPDGTDTMGRESRLLLPARGATTISLELTAREGTRDVEIMVNDRRAGRVEASATLTTVTVPVPTTTRRVEPLEISLRAARRHPWLPTLPKLELSVRRVEVHRAELRRD